jgi:hypothetical protein
MKKLKFISGTVILSALAFSAASCIVIGKVIVATFKAGLRPQVVVINASPRSPETQKENQPSNP